MHARYTALILPLFSAGCLSAPDLDPVHTDAEESGVYQDGGVVRLDYFSHTIYQDLSRSLVTQSRRFFVRDQMNVGLIESEIPMADEVPPPGPGARFLRSTVRSSNLDRLGGIALIHERWVDPCPYTHTEGCYQTVPGDFWTFDFSDNAEKTLPEMCAREGLECDISADGDLHIGASLDRPGVLEGRWTLTIHDGASTTPAATEFPEIPDTESHELIGWAVTSVPPMPIDETATEDTDLYYEDGWLDDLAGAGFNARVIAGPLPEGGALVPMESEGSLGFTATLETPEFEPNPVGGMVAVQAAIYHNAGFARKDDMGAWVPYGFPDPFGGSILAAQPLSDIQMAQSTDDGQAHGVHDQLYDRGIYGSVAFAGDPDASDPNVADTLSITVPLTGARDQDGAWSLLVEDWGCRDEDFGFDNDRFEACLEDLPSRIAAVMQWNIVVLEPISWE